jgi:hypothetical protein
MVWYGSWPLASEACPHGTMTPAAGRQEEQRRDVVFRLALEEDLLDLVPLPGNHAGYLRIQRRPGRQAPDGTEELLSQVFLIGRDLFGRLQLLVPRLPLLEARLRLSHQVAGHHPAVHRLRQDAEILTGSESRASHQAGTHNDGHECHLSHRVSFPDLRIPQYEPPSPADSTRMLHATGRIPRVQAPFVVTP